MSVELEDEEFPDLEVTLANGRMLFGPNMHPADLVRWVVACYERPDRLVNSDCTGPFTGADLVERYLRPGNVGGTSHAEMHAALTERWG